VTATERRTPPSAPSGAVFQDGFEHTFDVLLPVDELNTNLAGAALARVVIEIPTAELPAAPGAYARPRGAAEVELVAIDADDEDVLSGGTAFAGAFGELGDDGVFRFTSARFNQLLQQSLLGDPVCFSDDEDNCFGRFALRFSDRPNTLAPYLLRTDLARVAITYIPSDQ
jgi:hypothetical protein